MKKIRKKISKAEKAVTEPVFESVAPLQENIISVISSLIPSYVKNIISHGLFKVYLDAKRTIQDLKEEGIDEESAKNLIKRREKILRKISGMDETRFWEGWLEILTENNVIFNCLFNYVEKWEKKLDIKNESVLLNLTF